MAKSSTRVNVVLDEERAVKLQRLAERTHMNPGTLARSLLASALDETDPDARNVTALLDGIDDAWEQALAGLADAQAGRVVALEDL